MDVVVDHAVAVLQVLAFRNAVRAEENIDFFFDRINKIIRISVIISPIIL